MALTIKNPEVERLVSQLAILTGNTKTGVVREAARRELERVRREEAPARSTQGHLALRLEISG